MPRRMSNAQFRRLLEFRVALRGFLNWSETQAASVGLSAAQHQLLIAIRGHTDQRGPTIGEIATYLFVRHHSAIGLVNRAEALGLVQRVRDADDLRVVRVQLTDAGSDKVEALTKAHLVELQQLRPALDALVSAVDE